MRKGVELRMKKTNIFKILVLMAFLGLFIFVVANTIKNKEKAYEYALNGEIKVSSNCYYSDDAYCEVNGKEVMVDNYYEIEVRK